MMKLTAEQARALLVTMAEVQADDGMLVLYASDADGSAVAVLDGDHCHTVAAVGVGETHPTVLLSDMLGGTVKAQVADAALLLLQHVATGKGNPVGIIPGGPVPASHCVPFSVLFNLLWKMANKRVVH